MQFEARPADVTTRPETSDGTFEFVQALAADLSRGRLEMPGFPAAALRVRQAIAEEGVAADKLSRVIAADPALTARVLGLANSAALNPGGVRVTSLQRAITRVGLNIVRVAAMSFAMTQVRQHAELESVAKPLDALWQRTTNTSAAVFVVSKRLSGVPADEALLAGVLSSIGRLYLLTRSRALPRLFASPAACESIAAQWHAEVAKAVLENWDMPAAVVDAVHLQDDRDYEHDGPADMTDALILANVLVENDLRWPAEEAASPGLPAARRAQFGAEDWDTIQAEIAAELGALRSALGS